MIKQKLIFTLIFLFGITLFLNFSTTSAVSVSSTSVNLNVESNTPTNSFLGFSEVIEPIAAEKTASASDLSTNYAGTESSSDDADISVNSAASNYNPNYMKYVVYVVSVKNNGPNTATNVKVNAWLNRTYLKWIRDDGNGSYNHLTGIWTISSLNTGETTTIHLVGQVIKSNISFKSYAKYVSSNTIDTNYLNNIDEISLTVPSAVNIGVIQTASNYNPVYLHHIFLKIVVKNDGPDATKNLTVNCLLDPNILKYIADDGNGSYNYQTGIWNIGTLNSGSQVTLNIRAKVKVFETTIRNLVSIQSDNYDTTQHNNRAGIVLTVPKLTISSLANSLAIGTSSNYDKAVNIFNWVRDYCEYSFYYSTRYGAAGTLELMKGNCCDLSHLIVALARSAGLSARYKYGNCYFFNTQEWIGHVWANIYVDGPRGLRWYPADASNNNNDFDVIRNWNTSNFQLKGIYDSLPF